MILAEQPAFDPEIDIELWLDDVLNTHPPIPAGYADLSQLQAEAHGVPILEAGYAWERLPMWLAEIKDTYEDIGKLPILTLDICSSLPMYTQILRSLEFDRSGVRARGLIRESLTELGYKRIVGKDARLAPLFKAFRGSDKAQELLEAAIQESLFEITLAESIGPAHTKTLYEERLLAKTLQQKTVYTKIEAEHGEELGRGFRMVATQQPVNYPQLLQELQIANPGDDMAVAAQALLRTIRVNRAEKETLEAFAKRQTTAQPRSVVQFVENQARFIADCVVGHKRYRAARHFSLDSADPRHIAFSSLKNTPDTTRSLDIYTHSIASLENPRQHIQGDVTKELPFPDGSLALITSFDGWPYHFYGEGPPDDVGPLALERLEAYYRKLAPGGKMVFFPWAVYSDDHATRKYGQRALMTASGEFGRRNHIAPALKQIHRETLREWMSVSDQQISEQLSSILKNMKDDWIYTLIVDKPKQRSQKAYDNMLERNAFRDQIQD